MSIEINSDSFPLIVVNVPPDYIYDIDIITETFEKVFKIAKEKKTRISVIIDCHLLDGINPFVIAKLAKYLLNNRHLIEKYFNKTAALVENEEGLLGMVLGMYTPVRPFKLFSFEDKKDSIKWCCNIV